MRRSMDSVNMEIMYTAQLTQNILEKRCSIIINKGVRVYENLYCNSGNTNG